MSDLTKELEGACAKALFDLEITKRKSRIFTRPTPEGNLHWFGLVIEEHREKGKIFLTPTIGFRIQKLHEIIAEIEGDKFNQYLPPTIAQNIGYITKRKESLSIPVVDIDSAKDAAAQFAAMIVKEGADFFHSLSLEVVLEGIPSLATWEDASERLLIGKYLIGEKESDLNKFISDRITTGKKEDRYVERFEAFSESFLNWLTNNRAYSTGSVKKS